MLEPVWRPRLVGERAWTAERLPLAPEQEQRELLWAGAGVAGPQ